LTAEIRAQALNRNVDLFWKKIRKIQEMIKKGKAKRNRADVCEKCHKIYKCKQL